MTTRTVQMQTCRYCKLRIRWYTTWEAWGRPYGEQRNRLRCEMRPEGVAHEPPEE